MRNKNSPKPGDRNKEVDWRNSPKSILGWFLWTFPKKIWRFIIWIVASFVVTTAVVATYQLVYMRNLNIQKEIKEDKIKTWKRSKYPEWKSTLLRIWNKPGELHDEIWEMVKSGKLNGYSFRGPGIAVSGGD